MLNENLQYPSDFNSEVKDATAHLYKGVEKIIPEVEWPFHAPLIHEINKLKKEKNIAILTHNVAFISWLKQQKFLVQTKMF